MPEKTKVCGRPSLKSAKDARSGDHASSPTRHRFAPILAIGPTATSDLGVISRRIKIKPRLGERLRTPTGTGDRFARHVEHQGEIAEVGVERPEEIFAPRLKRRFASIRDQGERIACPHLERPR